MNAYLKNISMAVFIAGSITSVNAIECHLSLAPFSLASRSCVTFSKFSTDLSDTVYVGLPEGTINAGSLPKMGLSIMGGDGRDDEKVSKREGSGEGSGLKQNSAILVSAKLPNLANTPSPESAAFDATTPAEPDAWSLLLCG
ncbi:MAG: hypothetical protein WCL29_00550, partial [Pseudomonadota bacterium]